MTQPSRFTSEDWFGVWAITMIGAGAFAFRQLAIVPRATVGLCAAAAAPPICAPRAAVLYLQYIQAFGWTALALGILAFILGKRWPGILAIALGITAVINYNATPGIIGAALGIITWISLCTGRWSPAESK
jgi:hypothetical protein